MFFSPSSEELPSELEILQGRDDWGMVLAPPIDCEDLPLEGNTVEYVYSLEAKCRGKGASGK
jgi:hypothetical protein